MEDRDILPTPPSAAAQARSGLRHAGRWIGVPIAVVVAGVSLGSLVTSLWFVTTQKDDLLDSIQGVYPEEAVVCSSGTPSCATRAASQAGRPLAWLPDEDRFETSAFVVFDRAGGDDYTFQEGRRRDALITVDSGPPPAEQDLSRVIGMVDVPGGFSGQLFADPGPDGHAAQVRWSDGHHPFRLLVTMPFGDTDDAIRVARTLVDDVRYADPG